MKLPSPQLAQQLTKKLAPIYVVSGDDPLLLQEALDLIRDAAKAQGFLERTRVYAEGADWGKTLYANTQSLSLFAEKRIIELDLTNAKMTTASKIFQEYTERLSPDVLLIVRTNKLDSKSEQSSWYKVLDKIGVMIPVWPINLDQLPGWILQRAKKLNLPLTPAAANLIAAQTEGNLLAVAQELEKLSLLQLSGDITPDTLEEMLTDNGHFDIFGLVDSVLAGNKQRSLRIIDNLAAEDVEPTLVLWALTRELRTMADIAKQLKQGASLASLFPKFRIFDKRQPAVRSFLQRCKQETCWTFLLDAARIDRMIKGAEKGNVWDALKQLTFSIAIAT
jgi:DNA polymerase-3 subunit delta